MKKLDEPQPTPGDSLSALKADKVRYLLSTVAKVADARLNLFERRTEILKRLLEMIESTGGMWAWGVADEAATSIAPVASIAIGFTPEEKTAVLKTGLDPSMHEEFRIPIMQQMQSQSQGQSQEERRRLRLCEPICMTIGNGRRHKCTPI